MTTTINASTSAGLVQTADTSGVLALQTAGTTALTVDTSANVGIGTASPASDARLTLASPTTESYVMFSRTNSGVFDAAIGNTGGSILFKGGADSATVAGLTEFMRIDSVGNVGIGTASPKAKLHTAAGNVSTVGAIASSGLMIENYSGVGNVSQIGFGYSPGATNTGAYITYINNSAVGFGYGDIAFGTRTVTTDTVPTERMRIDSSGNLLVGGSTSITGNDRMAIYQPTSAYWGQSIQLGNTANGTLYTNTSGTGSYTAISFRNNGTTFSFCGSITVSGTATAYGVGTSDYRLKENIENYTGGLSAITALRPVTFTWKQSRANDVGFIAHEIQAVIPQAVQGEKDAVDTDGNPEYQSIFPAPAQMIANLVSAIQEQQALITQLQADVAALKGA